MNNLCRDGLHLAESDENLLLDHYINFFINFRFYRRVFNSSVNKSTNSSDIDSSRPNDIDQIWELKKIRLKDPNNVVLGNLNINFISRKFE